VPDSQSQPTRIAVVGCGIRGEMFATALAETADVSVVAVADGDLSRAERVAAATGARAYSTVAEVIANQSGVQAAIIATPDFAHTEAAVAFASRGIDLMIEKPLATSVREATQIADAANASGAKVMVAFENRWNPRFAEARRLVGEGAIGPLSTIIAHLNDTIFVPTRMLPWAGKSSPAWFLMPHTLDLALWLTGARPVDVVARGNRGVLDASGVSTWDSVTALFTLSDGTTTTLHSSWVLPESNPAVFDLRYEIHGAGGTVMVDGATSGLTLRNATRSSWPQLGVDRGRAGLRGFPIDMVHDFVGYVRGEGLDVPTLGSGLIVTAAIEAVHHSLESGSPVEIATPYTAPV
jgi:predicted dehydrogenase